MVRQRFLLITFVLLRQNTGRKMTKGWQHLIWITIPEGSVHNSVLHMSVSQEYRKGNVNIPWFCFLLPPAHEMVLTFGESLPFPVDLFWDHPHRQTQRFAATISEGVVNPVKLMWPNTSKNVCAVWFCFYNYACMYKRKNRILKRHGTKPHYAIIFRRWIYNWPLKPLFQ